MPTKIYYVQYTDKDTKEVQLYEVTTEAEADEIYTMLLKADDVMKLKRWTENF